MTDTEPPTPEFPISPELMKQQLALTRLRQAIQPHGSLSRIDEKGQITITGAPLENATLQWSNLQIHMESHEWLEEDVSHPSGIAWDELEERLFDIGLWEQKGWQLEANGPEDAMDDDNKDSIWMSATYWADDERDLAEALRWLVDEAYRVQVSNLRELAESRIRLEGLDWRDWEIDRMSLSRQLYLIKHQISGEHYTLDRGGKLRPREGCNVELFRVPG